MPEIQPMKPIPLLAIAACAILGAAPGPAAAAAHARHKPASDAPDLANGRTVFTACAYCHGLSGTGGPVGPSLKDVVGRPAAAIEGFAYSDAMKASGLTWTEANLDAFLTNPDAKVMGTRMVFAGLGSPTDRRDVIAYLKQIK
jgi:cytochrome c